MSLPTMTGVGRLTGPVELRFTASGTAVATIPLAFNARKRDDSGNWVDGDVFYVRGTAFKQLAEDAAESLDKGFEVVVTGRLKTDKWQDKQTGENRSATALLIDSLGPSLAYQTAKVAKAERGGGSFADGSQVRPTGPTPGQAQGDPWAQQPANVGAGQGAMDDTDPPF
jgi:single-strand DNA-binding protein